MTNDENCTQQGVCYAADEYILSFILLSAHIQPTEFYQLLFLSSSSVFQSAAAPGWTLKNTSTAASPSTLCAILFDQFMDTTRHFENENLKDRSTYLFWLFIAVAGLVGFQFLNPIIKPNLFSGSTTEWIVTCFIILILTVYFLFHKRFVSITFDASHKKITLTRATLLHGTKSNDYTYTDISFKDGKDPASFRKRATQFIELYNKTQKLIKLERTTIGENAFDNILTEFQQIKIQTDEIQHTT